MHTTSVTRCWSRSHLHTSFTTSPPICFPRFLCSALPLKFTTSSFFFNIIFTHTHRHQTHILLNFLFFFFFGSIEPCEKVPSSNGARIFGSLGYSSPRTLGLTFYIPWCPHSSRVECVKQIRAGRKDISEDWKGWLCFWSLPVLICMEITFFIKRQYNTIFISISTTVTTHTCKLVLSRLLI